jgi:hypothetical protein
MRWRCLDRVESFAAWKFIRGRKAVSFEEGSLLRNFDRVDEFPASLLIESCVELARWLAATSSGFSQIALLEQINDFRLTETPETGDLLTLAIEVVRRDEHAGRVEVLCRVECGREPVADGHLTLALEPLGEHCDPTSEAALWSELYGAA